MDAEMAQRNRLIKYSFIAVLLIFTLLFFASVVILTPLVTRAGANTVDIKLNLQGSHTVGQRVNVAVYLYNGPTKAVEQTVGFTYQNGSFTGTVSLGNNFDHSTPYAFLVKPEKYTASLFCGAILTGSQCKTAQIIIPSSGAMLDFTFHTIYGGDVAPVDGIVNSADMSNIIRNLGKLASGGAENTDINADGITDVTDYSLALYSLSKNAKDDSVNLAPPVPSPTKIPTITATPIPFPSPTPTIQPTLTPKPTSTPAPTATPKPTTVPTLAPEPTEPPHPPSAEDKPDYSKIVDMVQNPPVIGCTGTAQSCPITDLYNKPVDKGLGWATYYGDEHNPDTTNNIVAKVLKNRKGISYEKALEYIDDTFMAKQSNLTPRQAKATGKFIAYGATRSPSDIWKVKYLFGIDDVNKPKARFIGRILIMDCAASNHWAERLSTLKYDYRGWKNPPLNWILDLSKNGTIQLPLGYSGVATEVMEGKPGVVLVDESIIEQMVY